MSTGTGDSPVRAASPIRIHPPEVRCGEWAVSGATSSAALRLIDLTPLTKVLVRGWPGSTPAADPPAAGAPVARELTSCPMGRTVRVPGGHLVVGSGPDEWLILGPSGSSSAAASVVGGGGSATVVDLTHGGVVLRLTGQEASRCLAKLCALNLNDTAMPDGSVQRSAVAGVETTVVRDDQGPTPSYLLHSDRSSGQYLFDQLLDAGAEFGVEIDGYPDREL